jgi:(p)ppGpp synthase/HD superfamily hydrolase
MLNQSIKLAIEKHKWQMYGSKPYFYHLFQVYLEVFKYEAKEEILSLAFLHDTIEDTNITNEELVSISELMPIYVNTLSKNGSRNYYELCSKFYQTAIVKMADRICNVRECVKYGNYTLFYKYYKERKKFRVLYPKLKFKMILSLEILYLKGIISSLRIPAY